MGVGGKRDKRGTDRPEDKINFFMAGLDAPRLSPSHLQAHSVEYVNQQLGISHGFLQLMPRPIVQCFEKKTTINYLRQGVNLYVPFSYLAM